MAKTNGLVGGVTGKIGNVIGYYRRGNFLARAYNPHTTNARTRLQRLQRTRWITLMDFLRPSLPTLKIGFGYVKPSYELPFAMKANMPAAVVDSDNVSIDYSKVKFSNEDANILSEITHSSLDGTTLTVEVATNIDILDSLPAEYQDQENGSIRVLVIDERDGSIRMNDGRLNYDSSVEIDFETAPTPAKLHIYAFPFVRPDRVLEGDGIRAICGPTQYATMH